MKYLLDTCVISELAKPEPDVKVVDWLDKEFSEAVFLSVITIGKIRKGLIKLPDSKKKQQLSVWFNALLRDYADRILSIDVAVSETWGIIQGNAEKAGTPMSSLDSLIAATCLTYNLILVTRNESDFAAGKIEMVNPWK